MFFYNLLQALYTHLHHINLLQIKTPQNALMKLYIGYKGMGQSGGLNRQYCYTTIITTDRYYKIELGITLSHQYHTVYSQELYAGHVDIG